MLLNMMRAARLLKSMSFAAARWTQLLSQCFRIVRIGIWSRANLGQHRGKFSFRFDLKRK